MMSLKLSETFSIFSLDWPDYSQIDTRLDPFKADWSMVEYYKGKEVNIPGDWNSSFHPAKFFQVIKKPGDPNYSEAENEIGLTIWGGWKGYDHEVEINLFIRGKDVLSGKKHVSAEILKCGGAQMKVFHKGALITDFTETDWWIKKKVDKVWVDRLSV